MRLRDLLNRPEFGLVLLAGEDQLDRPVRRVATTDLLDPRRYLSGGELVLSGMMWRRTPVDSETFVAALVEAGVAGLGAGDAALGSVPADLVSACVRHGLPLFEVPVDVSFQTISDATISNATSNAAIGEAVAPTGGGDRGGTAGGGLSQHRAVLAAVADGAGLDELLSLVAADIGSPCWVVAATGRVLAGVEPLADGVRDRLAAAYLTAERLPRVVTVARQPYSLFAVPSRPASRLAGWFLAGAGDAGRWPDERQEAAAELATLLSLYRARLTESRRVERRLAAELVRPLLADGGETEIRAGLLACGLSEQDTFVVVALSLTGAGTAAEVAIAVAEEIARPLPVRAAVAGTDGSTGGGGPAGPGGAAGGSPTGGEVIAVFAVEPDAAAGVTDGVAAAVQALRPGLAGMRLAAGVSDPVTGSAGLHGAVEEARYAHRLATARSGRTSLVSGAELASHHVLLASVAPEVRRSFHRRLLGPLLDYDRAHHANLVRTLDTFLSYSGSWTRCAEELHVHVNTLRYRIRRIEQLTNRDLTRLDHRVDLLLALRLGRDETRDGIRDA